MRSISCSAESDGQALLTVHIEGAKQVTSERSSSTFLGTLLSRLCDNMKPATDYLSFNPPKNGCVLDLAYFLDRRDDRFTAHTR